MKIKKQQIIDVLIYLIFCIIFVTDWIVVSLQSNKPIFVLLSFLPVGVMSFVGFIKDKSFISIDVMIYIFMFLFAYYAPLHQYITNANIHNYATFTDLEYLFGNIIVLLFLLTYMITRGYLRKKRKKIIVKEREFHINDYSAVILMLGCIFCLIWLYSKGEILSLSSFIDDTVESSIDNDSLSGIITRIIRFFPAASVFVFMSTMKKNNFNTGKVIKYISNVVIYIIFFIVFNPIGGTMNRYMLFGTFVMLLANIFENSKHKSYVIIAAIFGFYFVFPAFNFFKFNSVFNISQFVWGGFDVNTNDYDSYQVMLQAIRHVHNNGITFGKNILSAVLCIIPRSIWHGKSLPSGQLIAETINAHFTNLSCPLFAEFYLAFGLIGVFIGTVLFANLIKIIEYGKQKDNYYYRGLYYIIIGMAVSYMRGSMLPMTSFLYCWIISFSIVYFICIECKKKV